MTSEPKRIKVIPHFMRLHEWIALEGGFFEAAGLKPETAVEDMHAISTHGPDLYLKRPQDKPYLDGEQVCSSACHWAVPMNAGAGMGKFVPDVYGVARYAIFVGPHSRIERLPQLANVPVGVGLMAGSHFSTLTVLETVLSKPRIKTANIGGPGRRLQALLQGEIEAATLLDPEIPIAQSKGLRQIAAGEFKTLFWVGPGMDEGALTGYFGVMRRADEALRNDPEPHLKHWAKNVPPVLRGDHDYSTFGLGEILTFESYTQEEYDETLRLARRWGLADHLREGSHRIESIAQHIFV
jgi:NitT/TauT family transport system substrate-binding protein